MYGLDAFKLQCWVEKLQQWPTENFADHMSEGSGSLNAPKKAEGELGHHPEQCGRYLYSYSEEPGD
jgi:hypothetical protein